MTTSEQLDYRTTLTRRLEAAGRPRVRVVPDEEGYPIVPGRHGHVQWCGPEPTGEARLYVFTQTTQMATKLAAIPGVHRWQTGDREARLWFPAHDAECLRAVLAVIKAKIRRPATSGRSAEALAAARARRRDYAQGAFSPSEPTQGVAPRGGP